MIERATCFSAVRLAIAIAGATCAAGSVGACGSSGERQGFSPFQEPSGSPSDPAEGSQSSAGFDRKDAEPPEAAPPPQPVDDVYGHSATTLYRLDPKTKVVTKVGDFDCSNEVTDLAIDETSNAFITSFTAFFSLDLATAHCSLIASADYPNSLSFVPKGTVDPSAEALVGYVGNKYVRIDPNSGAITQIGTLGGGYTSSGDVVSVKGGGTFLTALNTGCADCLLQIDPATGNVIQDYGSIGHGSVFGIAFWGGSIYGFTNAGELFMINATGGKVTTTPIAIPGAPADLSFWGAGSSTSVPAQAPDGTSFPVK